MGRARRTATFRAVRALLLFVALLTCYLSCTFFLMPYYSAMGRVQEYNSEHLMAVPPGQYLASLKSSTGLSASSFPLSARASFWVHGEDTSGGMACPPGFVEFAELVDHAPPAECVQQRHDDLRFIRIHSAENTDNEASERPLQISEFAFEFDEHSDAEQAAGGDAAWTTAFTVELLRHEVDGNCTHVGACKRWKHELIEEAADLDIEYIPHSLRCITRDAQVSQGLSFRGCALSLHIGNYTECFEGPHELLNVHQRNHGVCSFTVHWALYVMPPALWTVYEVWSWGVMGFMSVFSLFLYAALYLARRLHRNYIKQYYFASNTVSLKRDHVYDFVLRVSGPQFTQRSGFFRIMHRTSILFEQPLAARFAEEDVEGGKLSTITFTGTFKCPDNLPGSSYSVSWANQFIVAGFEEPEVRVEFCQRIPARVQHPLVFVLLPFFFLLARVRKSPRRSEFLRYADYLFLVVFVTLLHVTVLLLLFYVLVVFLNWVPEFDVFWGDFTRRPALPVAFESFFVLAVCAIAALPWTAHCVRPIADTLHEADHMQYHAGDDSNEVRISSNSSSAMQREYRSHNPLASEYVVMGAAEASRSPQLRAASTVDGPYTRPAWDGQGGDGDSEDEGAGRADTSHGDGDLAGGVEVDEGLLAGLASAQTTPRLVSSALVSTRATRRERMASVTGGDGSDPLSSPHHM